MPQSSKPSLFMLLNSEALIFQSFPSNILYFSFYRIMKLLRDVVVLILLSMRLCVWRLGSVDSAYRPRMRFTYNRTEK
jgi:hypothetical protein